MKKVKTSVIQVTIPEDLLNHIQSVCEQELRSNSNFICYLIKKHRDGANPLIISNDSNQFLAEIEKLDKPVEVIRNEIKPVREMKYSDVITNCLLRPYSDNGKCTYDGVDKTLDISDIVYLSEERIESCTYEHRNIENSYVVGLLPEKPDSITRVDFKFNDADENIYVMAPAGYRRLKLGDAGYKPELDDPIFVSGDIYMYLHYGLDRFVKYTEAELDFIEMYWFDDIIEKYGMV